MLLSKPSVPSHWESISPSDQKEYLTLQSLISAAIAEAGRAKFCSIFGEILEKLHRYVVRGEKGDANRALVCGVVWFNNSISINTRQLTATIGKCKSSINCGFQSIGYVSAPADTETTLALMEVFPFMKGDFAEIRQWTIRRKVGIPQRSIFRRKAPVKTEYAQSNSNSPSQKDDSQSIPTWTEESVVIFGPDSSLLFDPAGENDIYIDY